jgi:uncharacterized membrane protein SpoIIM required for sporulation/ABC-type transport system involved in multi-copper enzyme maturation permease subunit
MRHSLSAIWMVARREWTDQFRDWRIVVPMLVLVSVFPFIADDTTRQAVNFMNRYGGSLILDHLVPFVVLVIGFFPLSFTLVVALESFVGEKERGTIEPLLSSPLEDSHMYLGKLLVGIITPLAFSYASIGIYLLLVSRRDVTFPNAYILALILLLTFAHAVLMVSSAIVISVQATTIRSANLLASFVVVPVAFLLQAETFLIFWGNEDVLWFAIAGVALLAVLLVRLGLSHFRREYLLGREIDMLNIKLIGRTFRDRFKGQATSAFEWYRSELPLTLKGLRRPLALVCGLAVIASIVTYLWVLMNVPAYLNLTPDRAAEFRTLIAKNLVNLDALNEELPAVPLLFLHNVRTQVVLLMLGLVSFGTLGLTGFLVNIVFDVGLVAGAQLVGYSPWLVFATGLLPHGLFEFSALFVATAAMLKVGAQLVTPQADKSLGETLLLSLADWCRVFVGVVLPLLAVAALIEIYITPRLIQLVFSP